jgi:hypothetical protein
LGSLPGAYLFERRQKYNNHPNAMSNHCHSVDGKEFVESIAVLKSFNSF